MVRERATLPSVLYLVAALALPLGAAAQVTRLGSEFRVNTYTPSLQAQAAVASDADGDFVVAWGGGGHDGSEKGVFARRFSSAGAALGGEFQVNSHTQDEQGDPAIDFDDNGDFVVVWTSSYQDGAYAGVFARRFSNAGVPLASELQVNAFTPGFQDSPAIAVAASGDFVVAWRSVFQDGSYQTLFARRFSSAGIAQTSEVQVNVAIDSYPQKPSIATEADGDFVVSWESYAQDGSNFGLLARRFSSAGGPMAAELQVNTFTTGAQRYPAVASDDDGDFVVSWQSAFQDGANDGIFARRFSSAGAPLTGELQVNAFTNGYQRAASVSAAASGDFVVAWQDNGRDGSLYGAFARRFSSAGVALTGDFQLNTYTSLSQAWPSVAAEASGAFVVAWQSDLQDGSSYGIFGQRFALPILFDVDGNGSVSALTDGLLALRYAFGFRGATLVSGAIDTVGCTRCNSPTIEAYLASITQPLAGLAQALPIGGEIQVNTRTQSTQRDPAVAADGDGDFVVAWRSFLQDGSYHGVFAQRFSSAGTALAVELQVNSYTSNHQGGASLARETNGDFVVVWASNNQDGFSYGIFAQRFSSAGARLAGEFQVNTYTPNFQYTPSVAADPDGDFTVVWGSLNQDGGQMGIFGQRFSSAGAPLAIEFRVNTHTADHQTSPVVAASASGDFVVVWDSYDQDASATGVFAQRFSSAGALLATEFQANIFTFASQGHPSVATSASGDFVIAWMSYTQDGSMDGVFARRFSSAGAPLGSEFPVNDFTAGAQRQPSLAAGDDGDFVVTWDSNAQDGSSRGVFARRFTSAGTPVASELQVNSFTTGEQALPAVAAAANGAFVIAWSSGGQDGDAEGVFAQRFGGAIGLDVDGDGSVQALTDTLLTLRYTFGFRGATLVTGAVGAGCTRCDAASIEAYLTILTN